MVSVLPALLASVIALRILSAPKLTLLRIALGGVSVGAGIGVMHYTGMFAMQMDATLYYDPLRFAISILVAIGMAMFALWIHYGVRRALNLSTSISLILAGTGMGGAIASMHYTGMAAAQFVAFEQAQLQMTEANTLLARYVIATCSIRFETASCACVRFWIPPLMASSPLTNREVFNPLTMPPKLCLAGARRT